jgi:hypothetical protein
MVVISIAFENLAKQDVRDRLFIVQLFADSEKACNYEICGGITNQY